MVTTGTQFAMNFTTGICLLLVAVTSVLANGPCCMPARMQGEVLTVGQVRFGKKIIDSAESSKMAVDYNKGIAAVRQMKNKKLVHVLVDYQGRTMVEVNGRCVYNRRTVTKQTSRCFLCTHGTVLGSAYFGANDNILEFKTHSILMKSFPVESGDVYKNLKLLLSTTEVDSDSIVPVGELGSFNVRNAKVGFLSSFVNFVTEIVDKDAFSVPKSCQSLTDDDMEPMKYNASPKLSRTSVIESLPKETQQAMAFISL